MVDWADMRMKQCDKSPYAMKGIELSHDTEQVVKEAMEIAENAGLENVDGPCLLAALVSPGIGFSYEQLKTLPISPDKIKAQIMSGAPIKTASGSASGSSSSSFAAASSQPADND